MKYNFYRYFTKVRKFNIKNIRTHQFIKTFKFPIRVSLIFIGFLFLYNTNFNDNSCIKPLITLLLDMYYLSHYSNCYEYIVN